MKIKVLTRAVILLLLLAVFGRSIIFSENGVLRYLKVKSEIEAEKSNTLKLQNKIMALEENIALWQKDDFLLERMAREELQLGLAQEKVYILPE